MGRHAAARYGLDGGAASPPRLQRAYLVALVLALTVHALWWAVSEPGNIFSDFYKAYFHAAVEVLYEGPIATWMTDDERIVGFVNLPIVAWLFAPLVPLGEEPAAWTFLALGGVAALAAWHVLARIAALDPRRSMLLLALFLANGPLVNSLREGNTTHFVLLMLLGALLLWRAQRPVLAGAVLAACAIIKPPLVLYGLYFVLRGRWRIVAGGAVAGLAVVALSVAVFGVAINIGWYRACVAPFLEGVIPAFNVQSIDGFLIRLDLGTSHLLHWLPVTPSGVHRAARTVLTLALFGTAAWAIVRARRGKAAAGPDGMSRRDLTEFALVAVLAFVTTPVSWTHYYLFLLLPWGLHLGGMLLVPADRATRWMTGASMALASLPAIILPLQPDWLGGIAARTLVSAWLIGGLLMLAALLRGLFLARDDDAPSAAPTGAAPIAGTAR